MRHSKIKTLCQVVEFLSSQADSKTLTLIKTLSLDHRVGHKKNKQTKQKGRNLQALSKEVRERGERNKDLALCTGHVPLRKHTFLEPGNDSNWLCLWTRHP